MLMSMCVCVSARKTPIIRCHVVLEAVTCQVSSCYLSVTASLLCVCGWLGSLHPNTHICCSSMAWTTARSAIKMTLTVKHNWTQTHFRHFLTLRLDDETSRQLSCSQRVQNLTVNCLRNYENLRKVVDLVFKFWFKNVLPSLHYIPRYKSCLWWGLEKLECESVTVMEVSCQTGRQVAAT